MPLVHRISRPKIHHPRNHAAVRTDDYVFSQLIPYIGNKRKLLHLVEQAVLRGGPPTGPFVDLFSGSTVVARWAKKAGYAVVANDWEPYSHEIALGTVVPNRPPRFAKLGGALRAFESLNGTRPRPGYVAEHLCPADDDDPDPERERMFFTRSNGERIDAVRGRIDEWEETGRISRAERAYLLAALIYSVSYVSNTSGVFKAYHHGWGGKTGTALYRILSGLRLVPPLLFDNGSVNLAFREDADLLAPRLFAACRGRPDVAYLDPPYNQHPYGSNYHLLNTITLWDKPVLDPRVVVDGEVREKAAIRKDWRTERRSAYNSRTEAADAFARLVEKIDARRILVSYSTDGNIPLPTLLEILASRGRLEVFAESYKRYRVSTPRMSPKARNVEIVAAVDTGGKTAGGVVPRIVDEIHAREEEGASR